MNEKYNTAKKDHEDKSIHLDQSALFGSFDDKLL